MLIKRHSACLPVFYHYVFLSKTLDARYHLNGLHSLDCASPASEIGERMSDSLQLAVLGLSPRP